MSRQVVIALCSGSMFGAGLAISGMADPSRVRGFLDLAGAFDPTLLFVMAGALLPMAIAWRFQRAMQCPCFSETFEIPAMRRPDKRLMIGAVIFGIGWGIAGLCPGPAIVGLALIPAKAAVFVAAMLLGMGLYRVVEPRL